MAAVAEEAEAVRRVGRWRALRCGGGMSQVVSGLFIGSLRDAADEQQLLANQVTHVLSVHDGARRRAGGGERQWLCVALSDRPESELLAHVPQTNDFIHAARRQGGRVLVHCLAGVSRSVAVVVAYLMSASRRSYWACMDFVLRRHPHASPNFGFRMQLCKFDSRGLSAERERLLLKFPASERDLDLNVFQLGCYADTRPQNRDLTCSATSRCFHDTDRKAEESQRCQRRQSSDSPDAQPLISRIRGAFDADVDYIDA